MPRLPILAVLPLALICAFGGTPAVAQSSADVWRRAEMCLPTGDTAVCWLRLSADFIPHRLLRVHSALIRRAELLRSIGVEPLDTSRLQAETPAEPAREAMVRRRRERVERMLGELLNSDPLSARIQGAERSAPYAPASEHAGLSADEWRALIGDRVTLMHLAEEGGRLPMARATAEIVLEMGLLRRDPLADGSAVLHAVDVLLPSLSIEQRAALARRVEQSAIDQGGLNVQSLLPAAHAAWIAAGRPDEAERLISDWTPRARAQSAAFSTGQDPDGALEPDGQPSALQGLQSILVSLGRDDEAAALGWLDPSAGLAHDLANGLGLSRLDARLSGRPDAEHRQILASCVIRAEARTDIAEECATRLLSVPGDWQSRMFAAQSALQAAQMAATLDEPGRAERLARLAVAVGAQAERDRPADQIPMPFGITAELLNIAAAMVAAQPSSDQTAMGSSTP